MSYTYIISTVTIFIILSLSSWVYMLYKKIHEIDNDNYEYKKLLLSKEGKLREAGSRVQEIERAVEEEYHVSIRREVTNMYCDFTPFELSTFRAAIVNSIYSEKIPVSTIKVIMKIYDKINHILEHMYGEHGKFEHLALNDVKLADIEKDIENYYEQE